MNQNNIKPTLLGEQHWRSSIGRAASGEQHWGCSTGGAALGEQHWGSSGESTRLPPMWPGIDSRILRHMWVSLLILYSAPRGFSPGTPVFPSPQKPTFAGIAQLASARLSEQGVPSSILGDFNVCFHIPLIRVAIGLNIRDTEH